MNTFSREFVKESLLKTFRHSASQFTIQGLCWVTTLIGGPEGCSLRVIVTQLFPKKWYFEEIERFLRPAIAGGD